MNLLILGASGLVGGNALTYFGQFAAHSVRGTHFSYPTESTCYFNTANLNDPANAAVLADFCPDVIMHCGALTHVDYCEAHPDESYQKTVDSTRNVLVLAQRFDAKVVYISTDYVFNGENGPYAEDSPTEPVCVYGRHKLTAEQLVQNSGLPFIILRITNVYGSEQRAKNFVARLLHQMHGGESINASLPADQYATPINALDIARATDQLLAHSHTGIYHLASTDYLNRFQLADRIVSKFGYEKATLVPITTASLAQPAPRPLNGGLLAHKFLQAFPTFRFTTIDQFLANNPYA